MENYNFRKFEKTNARQVNRITVTSSRSFGFPTKFFQENKISGFKYVVIYFDDDNKAVAFKFTNDEQEKHKFTIIKSNQGYGGSIVANSFFKTYSLEPNDYRGKYEWEKRNIGDIGEVYVIKLVKRAEVAN